MATTLSPDTDRRVVALAVAEGLVARDAVDAVAREHGARRSRGDAVPSLAQALCEEGLLEWLSARALVERVRAARHETIEAPRSRVRRAGPYVLLDELGRGGMGAVYRARHVTTGALRAVKVLSGSADAESVARFRRESETLARVAGAGVVTIHEAGLETGELWLAMALMAGGTLGARLQKLGPLPWREAATLVAGLARTLERCHAAALVHRDLKPGNVLLDEEGRAWLADFGLVRDLTAASLTETGTVMGTLPYMSPEQLEGAPVDARTDIYALAVILHELVAGALPYSGQSLVQQRAARSQPRKRLRERGAPQALDAVLDEALAVDREKRTATAGELAAALEQVVAEADKPAPHRLPLALILGALVLLALAGVVVALGVTAARCKRVVADADRAVGASWTSLERLGAAELGDEKTVASLARAREDALAAAERARRASLAGAASIESVTKTADTIAARVDRALRASEAAGLLRAGRVEEASQRLATEGDPAPTPFRDLDASELELRGAVLFARRDYDGAIRAYTRALDLGRERVRYDRGRAAARSGRAVEALRDFDALERAPGEPRERYADFATLLYARDPEKAWWIAPPPAAFKEQTVRSSLRRALEAIEKPHVLAGPQRKEWFESLKWLYRLAPEAVADNPRVCEPFVEGMSTIADERWTNDRDDLARMAREYVAIWPDNPVGHYFEAYTLQEKPVECLAAVARAYGGLLANGQREEIFDGVEGALVSLALTVMNENAPSPAGLAVLASLRRAAERDKRASAWLIVVGALRWQGRRNEILAAAREGERWLPPDGPNRAWLHQDLVHEIVFALGKAGDHDAAIETAKKHLAEDTSNAARLALLAAALAAGGRTAELAALEPDPATKDELLLHDLAKHVLRARVSLHQVAEARKLVAEIGRAHPAVREKLLEEAPELR